MILFTCDDHVLILCFACRDWIRVVLKRPSNNENQQPKEPLNKVQYPPVVDDVKTLSSVLRTGTRIRTGRQTPHQLLHQPRPRAKRHAPAPTQRHPTRMYLYLCGFVYVLYVACVLRLCVSVSACKLMVDGFFPFICRVFVHIYTSMLVNVKTSCQTPITCMGMETMLTMNHTLHDAGETARRAAEMLPPMRPRKRRRRCWSA